MSRPRLDVIGLGECMVELRSDGPLGAAPALARGYGGDVLNALVTAARLGARAGFITQVGADPFGTGLLAAWESEGIDLSCARLVLGENGVYFVSLPVGGEREFTYRRHGSAASRIGPQDLDEDYIASAGCLLISGVTQAISASAELATLAACQIARRHGVRVAFDPNYREQLWAGRGGLAAARAAMHSILPWVDILLPSYPYDAALLDAPGATAARLATILSTLAPEVALKCGADGSGVAQRGQWQVVPPVHPGRVLDTTGAGDAWNGAYLVRRLRGGTPLAAAAAANSVAAAKLTHRGAIAPRGAWPDAVLAEQAWAGARTAPTL